MYFFINFFLVILLHYFVKVFFSFKTITFKKISILYLLLFLLLLIISYRYDYLNQEKKYNYLLLIMNLFIFLSYILTIGLKSLDSPTLYIIEYLKVNNITNKTNILSDLKDKNLLNIRIQKLKDEKLIYKNNDYIELTSSGKIFCFFLRYIMKFLNIKNEG